MKDLLFPEMTEIARVLTPTIVLMELRNFYLKQDRDEQFLKDLDHIRGISTILEALDEKVALRAGELHALHHTREFQISYIDCILWAMAEIETMKVVSTDKHFQTCSCAVYIAKEASLV